MPGFFNRYREAAAFNDKVRESLVALNQQAERQNTQSHVILGVLVVLCAVMTIGVVYICLSRGLAFLARESA